MKYVSFVQKQGHLHSDNENSVEDEIWRICEVLNERLLTNRLSSDNRWRNGYK